VPARTPVSEEAGSASDIRGLPSEPNIVAEREEWIRRDQIAPIVRSAVAEAILPLQEAIRPLQEAILPLQKAIASITQRLDALASAEPVDVPAGVRRTEILERAPTCPPPAAEDAPQLPAIPPRALTRFGELADKLRRERGINVTPTQLATLLLERVATVLDERAAAELTNNSMFARAASSSLGDRSS
jgi:hypothetical protein